MARVLITGGTGFIGSHLARKCLERGDKVTLLVRPNSKLDRVSDIAAQLDIQRVPLTDQDRLDACLAQTQPEIVFHLGARTRFTAKEDLSDLQGQKIAGAGLNLNWLKLAGVSEVQSSLATAYTEMNTNVYEGWIMFPSAWVNLKLYEPGPYYTLIGFGSMTWHGLTINKDTYDELPDDFKVILHEVSADYEQQTGSVNASEYDRLVDELRGLITVTEIDPSVRKAWAESLAEWPQSLADDLEAQGLPAKKVLNLVLDRAEANGYEWPVRYVVE